MTQTYYNVIVKIMEEEFNAKHSGCCTCIKDLSTFESSTNRKSLKALLIEPILPRISTDFAKYLDSRNSILEYII